ncbi:hypothetical protein V3C99_014205 [Haemonchus contortus]
MCLRKKTPNAKFNHHPAFAPQTFRGVDMNPGQPPPLGSGEQGAGNFVIRDSKEKVKAEGGKLLARGFPSPEFVKRRRDDDTLREVGNVMPEYDCDKDDPQPLRQVEKTQDFSLRGNTGDDLAVT